MEVFIERHYSSNEVEIYLKEQRGLKDVFFSFNGEKTVEQVVNMSEGKAVELKPLLKIPMNYFSQLISAFVDEGKKMNLRTENENHLKGKLEATENHLADMQKITSKLLKLKE